MTEIKITKDMIEYDAESDEPYSIEAVTVTYEGKRYRVDIVSDMDSSPFDDDCYSEEDIASWRSDDWSFVGIIVTPLDVPESKQFELSDSLWGLEYNFPLDPPQEINGLRFTRTDIRYQVMVHPVPGMLREVISLVKAWELETAVQSFIYS